MRFSNNVKGDRHRHAHTGYNRLSTPLFKIQGFNNPKSPFFVRVTPSGSVPSLFRSVLTLVGALVLLSFAMVSLTAKTPQRVVEDSITRVTAFAHAVPVDGAVPPPLTSAERTGNVNDNKIDITSNEKSSVIATKRDSVSTSTENVETMPEKVAKQESSSSSFVVEDAAENVSEVSHTKETASERRSPAKSFMVVFMGHSGSTAFITELRNHPNIEVEELEPVDHFEYERNTDLALKYAREILDRGIAKGKVPGFKIRPYHIRQRPSAWEALAKEYNMRIFWQFRVNVMKQAVGEYRSRVLNDRSVVEGVRGNEKACDESSGYKCRFKIENLPALHDLLNDFSVNDDYLGDAVRLLKRDDDVMALKYEDYLYRRNETMKDSLDFLGVDSVETAPLRFKASPDSLCDMVENFQEVCRAFYACQLWRPYLDDPHNGCYCKPTNGARFEKKFCYRKALYQTDH